MKLDILVFTEFMETNAVFQLRLKNYLEYLKEKGLISNFFINNLKMIDRADLIILHRFYPIGLNYLKKIIENRIPVIIETDDLLLEINKNHPDFSALFKFNPIWDLYKNFVSGMTVSTEYLKKYFGKYLKNIIVIRNTLPFHFYRTSDKDKQKTKVKIVYIGTPTHQEDFNFLRKVIKKISQMEVEIYFIGFLPEYMEKVTQVHFFNFEDNYFKMLRKLRGINAHIGLAPLKFNKFNKAKSNIKYLEYTYAGIVGIYSDIEPYKGIKGGIVVKNKPNGWLRSIMRLINDEKLRNTLLKKAKIQIEREFNFEKEAKKLFLYYKKIVSEYKDRSGDLMKDSIKKLVIKYRKKALKEIKNIEKCIFFRLYIYLKVLYILTRGKGRGYENLIKKISYTLKKEIYDYNYVDTKNLISLLYIYEITGDEHTDSLIKVINGLLLGNSSVIPSNEQLSYIIKIILSNKHIEKIFPKIIDGVEYVLNVRKEIDPMTKVIIYYRLGEARGKIGGTKESSYYKKALDILLNKRNKDFNDIYLIGIIYKKLNDYEKAFKYLKKAIKECNKTDYSHLSLICFYLGEIAERLNKKSKNYYYKKSLFYTLKIKHKTLLQVYRIASLYKRFNEFKKASYWFKEVLKLDVSDDVEGGAYFHLGEIEMKLGNNMKAKEYFKKCFELNPSHKKAKEYLLMIKSK